MTEPKLKESASAGDAAGQPATNFGQELRDLTRAAGRLLGIPAFVLSIVAGREPFSKERTILSELDEQVRRDLLYTLCLGVVDGEALIIEDTGLLERQRDVRIFQAADVGCCMCLPLRANGWQVIGLLCLLGKKPRDFSKTELSLIGDIAQLAAVEMRREAGLDVYSGNELHLRTRRAVLNGLLSENPSEQAIGELLGGLCRNLRWDAGSVWFSGASQGGGLVCIGRWAQGQLDGGGLYDNLSYDVEDMLGQVWSRQEPVWVSDLSALAEVRRATLARQAGFRAGLWFPVINDGKTLGVIELLAAEPHPDHDRLPLFVLSLGRQIGDLVSLVNAPQAPPVAEA